MYRYCLDSTGECAINGKFAEELFVKRFEERFGVKPIKTDVEQDKYEHKDFVCTVKEHTMTCDVKHPKKIRREDMEISNDFTWVEFTSKGYDGWLYGKQDYIAFLLPNCREFLMVPREALLKYCQENVTQEFALEPDMSYHKLYVRTNVSVGKIDCMTLLSYKELEQIEKTWRI